ncbi:MAG: hypothetical protein HY298_02615 [Verrucomicrobia bacterium]|nr:hypothetical protein [Verrucomicrobiota bacterium]
MKTFRTQRSRVAGIFLPGGRLRGFDLRGGRNQVSRSHRIRKNICLRQQRSIFARSLYCLLYGLALVAAVKGQAADQGVNLQYLPPTESLESPAGEPTAFWDRYKATFDQNVEEQFADDFRPFNALNWSLKLADRDSQQLRERIPDAARHSLSRAVVDSFRETVLELPFMVWLKDHQTFVTDLLLNSLGNVHEEAVSPLDPSYRAAERSWWQQLSASRSVNYGVRPFRTSPYAFVSMAFKDGDRVFLLANARYYYHLFAEQRVELALSVPLTHGISFDVGTSYEFGQRDDQKGLVVKLYKQFKNGGYLHIGLDAKRNPVLFAGIALPF